MYKRVVWAFVLLCLLGPLALDAAYPELLIKIPTRGRPAPFFEALDAYYANLSGTVSYHFVISCDQDDLLMNSPEIIEKLRSYPHLSVYFGKSKSKVAACNCDIDKHPNFDILLLGSDDMIPIVYGYDRVIVDAMRQFCPQYDGMLHFNDGFKQAALITLPIMGRRYYQRFGYVYFPGYVSLFCDTEMTDVALFLNKVTYFDTVLIEHRHPDAGKRDRDELYIRNDSFYGVDSQLYNRRKHANFGLSLRDIGARR